MRLVWLPGNNLLARRMSRHPQHVQFLTKCMKSTVSHNLVKFHAFIYLVDISSSLCSWNISCMSNVTYRSFNNLSTVLSENRSNPHDIAPLKSVNYSETPLIRPQSGHKNLTIFTGWLY